jgi:hypothetical protein
MTKRIGESGNIFFTLFGAVALVGVIGVATSNLMRGPVGTVMKLNQTAKAESQLQIARKMAALEAAQNINNDCEPDGFLEPLAPDKVSGADCSGLGLTGGGCMPAAVGASQNDPWGTRVGYCAWDHGPTIGVCDPANLLDGVNATTETVIAVISAGPNRTFETTCGDDPAYIQPANGGGDDIVMEWTYDDAVQGAGGLWGLKSSDPDTAEILNNKNIEVGGSATFGSGASFASNVSLGAGSLLDLTAGSLLNLPDQSELIVCSLANDEAMRVDNSIGLVLQICDFNGVGDWVDIGGSGSASSVSGSEGDVQFNSGDALYAVGNFNYDVATDRLRVGGSAAADDTLEVTGTADISGDLEADQFRAVTGGTAGNAGLSFNSAGTLGVYGSGTNVGLSVAGSSRLIANSLGVDVIGNFDASGTGDIGGTLDVGGDTRITADLDVSGALEVDGDISDALGAVTINDDLVVNQSLQVGTSFAADNFELDTIGSGEGLYQYSSGTGDGFALRTAGVNRIMADGSGDINMSGDVGIALGSAPTTDLDIGGILRLRSDATAVAGGVCTLNGSIAYTSGDELLICSNVTGNWETIGTSGGGGGGGGGIWQRSTGIIRIDPTYFNSTDDFVIGSLQLDDETSGDQDQRMFFENSTGAFRAGVANGTEWDTRGDYSVAMGLNTQATADGTFAVGNNAQARATDGLALGRDVTVAAGALNSMGIGLGIAAGVEPEVSGVESLGIFMQDQSGVDLAANNTMALFGGRLLIDPNVPATELTTSLSLTVDVEGDVGAVQFCSEEGTFCFTAEDVSTGATGAPGNDREMVFNSAGALWTDTSFVFTSAGYLGIGTTVPGTVIHARNANEELARFESTDNRALLTVRDNSGSGYLEVNGASGVMEIGVGTSALVNDGLVIDASGAVGVGTTSLQTLLNVDGTIKMSYGGEACDANRQGAIHFDSVGEDFYVCQDGANWQRIITTGGGAGTPSGGNDREIQFNSGGDLAGNPNFVFTSTGNFGLGLSNPDDVFDVVGSAQITGPTVLGSSLNVTGQVDFSSGLNVTSATDLSSTLDVTGATTLNNTLSVVGANATTLGGSLDVTGQVDFSSGLNVALATGLSSTLDVTGATTLDGLLTTTADSNMGGLVTFTSTGAVLLPVGDTGQQPSVPQNGMIRYNTDNDKFEAFQGGIWQDILTSAVAGGAAAPDRGIQFNSGGDFTADANFVFTSAGRLGVGNPTPQSNIDVHASAINGIELSTDGAGPASQVIVALTTERNDLTEYLGQVGASNRGWSIAAYDHAYPIAQYQNDLHFNFVNAGVSENLLSLKDTGGVGIAVDNPQTRLDVDGTIKMSYGGEACDANRQGAIHFDSVGEDFYVCQDGSTWQRIITTGGGAGTPAGGNDREIQFNSGGDLAGNANFVFTSAGFLGVGTSTPTYQFQLENNQNNPISNAVFNLNGGASAVAQFVANADGGFTTFSQTSVAGGDVGYVYNNTAGGLFMISEHAASSSLAFQTGATATDRMTIDHGGTVRFTSSGAVLLPVGNTAEQPSAPENGMIRYNTDSDKFEAYQGGVWQDILTSAVAGGASAPDRGIQFNSGGDFAADANFVFTSAGRLGVGTDTPNDPLHIVADNPDVRLDFSATPSGNNAELKFLDQGALGSRIFWDRSIEDLVFENDMDNNGVGDIVLRTNAASIVVLENDGLIRFSSSGAAVLNVGDTSERPSTAENGMIRYNTDSDKFEAYQGGAWQDILTSAVAGGASAPDRGIQFNSGGDFAADANFVFTSAGNLGLGTANPLTDIHVLDSNPEILLDLTAPGDSAIGFSALGTVYAGMEWNSTNNDLELAIDATNAGIGDFGITTGGDLALAVANSGDVSIGAIVAQTKLDVDGTIKMSYGGEACDANRQGAIHFDSVGEDFYVCQDGSTWQRIITTGGGAGTPAGGNDREIQFNSGGDLTGDANFAFTSAGLLGVGTSSPIFDLHVENNQNAATYNAVVNYDAGATASANLVAGANGGYSALVQSSVAGGDVGILYNNTSAGLIVASEHATSSNLAFQTGAAAVSRMVIDHDGLVTFTSSGAVLLPVGDTSSQPSSPQNGMIRYNTDNDKFEAYQGGAWQDILTSAVAGGASAPDRGIQFNSGGDFAADANFTYTSVGRLGVGNAAPSSLLDVGDSDMRLQLSVSGNSLVDPYSLGFETDGGNPEQRRFTVSSEQGSNRQVMQFSDNGGASTSSYFGLGRSTDTGATWSPDFVIKADGQIGMGMVDPDTKLDVEGSLKIAYGGEACDAAREGGIHYNSSDNNFYVCQTAGSWSVLATGTPSAAAPDRGVQFNSGGSFTADANFVYTSAGYLGIGDAFPDRRISVTDNGVSAVAAFTNQNDSNSVRSSMAINRMRADATAPLAGFGARLVFNLEGFTNDSFSNGGGIATVYERNQTNDTTDRDVAMLFQTVLDNTLTEQLRISSDGIVLFQSTGAARLNIGDTAQRPSTPQNGMIRYNTDNDKFEAYQGGAWQDILTSAVAGGASAPDRGIQFNSGGDFAADANFTYTSVGSLGLGTANPATELHVYDASGAGHITVEGDTSAASSISFLTSGDGVSNVTDASTNGWSYVAIGETAASPLLGEFVLRHYDGAAVTTPFVFTSAGQLGVNGVVPNVSLDVSGTIQISDGGEACTTAADGGMVRWDGAVMQYCDGATWQDFASGATASPGVPDRGIQFNSGGDFAAEANFTYTSAGDLIVGSYQIEDTTTGSEDSRMFFDVSNSAFRAGSAAGVEWNYASSGQYSTAFGQGTVASGDGSTAMGTFTVASGNGSVAMGGLGATASGSGSVAMGGFSRAIGDSSVAIGNIARATETYSVAIGSNATASGYASTAMGRQTTASGTQSAALGSYASAGAFAMAIGLSSTAPGTHPVVTGQQSLGIFMGNQNAVDLSSVNTMGLFGGSMVIDPAVPATNLSPDTALEIEGTLKIAYGGEACDANREGAIRFVSATNSFSFCADTGNDWETVSLGAGVTEIDDLSDAATNYTSGSMYLGQGAATAATGINNTVFGYNAANSLGATYGEVTVIGAYAADAMIATTGVSPVIIGANALGAATDGGSAVVVGTNALQAATGNNATTSTAIGTAALYVAGNGVLARNNTAVGDFAGGWFVGGQYNVMIGKDAGRGDSGASYDGSDNVFIGSASGLNMQATSERNVFIGQGTGATLLGGSDNILIGNAADVPFASAGNYINIGDVFYGSAATGELYIGSTGALTMPDGTTAQRPGTVVGTDAANGMLRYNTDTGRFEGYQAGAWQDILTGAIAGGAAAPDRGIQFNSGNSFAADANFTYTSAGDFIVGSYQIDDTGTGSEDSRMFFDVSNSAFRAGSSWDKEWDYVSSGQYSTAFGRGSEASGDYSFAAGAFTRATSTSAVALGERAEATGTYSFAVGESALASNLGTVALGRQANASGLWSTAIGFNAESSGELGVAIGFGALVGDGDPNSGAGDGSMNIALQGFGSSSTSRVTGQQSLGIFSGEHSGYNLSSANTFGVFGASMVLDPNNPATNLSADTALEIEGSLKIAYGGEACDAAREGAIRFVSATNSFEFCADNANDWEAVSLGGGTLTALTDTNITAPANGEVLYYSGSDWVNNRLAINDLNDGTADYTSGNLFLGQGVVNASTTGANNVVVGTSAADSMTSGQRNVILGSEVAEDLTTGHSSVLLGYRTASAVTGGYQNVAIGAYSGQNMSYNNTYLGERAGRDGAGNNNTMIGRVAGMGVTSGNNNVILGSQSESAIFASGSNNILLGAMIDTPQAATSNYLNLGNIFYGSMGTGELYIGSNGALRMPVGGDAQRPGTVVGTTAVNGMLRYNSASDRFEGYQGGSWQDILTGAIAGGAAAPDRGIQFNSGNSFAADANFTYTSVGNLGLGTATPAVNLDITSSTRSIMSLTGDSTTLLTAGIAMLTDRTVADEGLGTTLNNLSGGNSGWMLFGVGEGAPLGNLQGDMALRYFDGVSGAGDPVLNIDKAGDVLIGSQALRSAFTKLEVDGTLKVAYSGEDCDASREGGIHYNSSDDNFYVCQTAGSWTVLATGSPNAAAPDRGIQFNSGNSFAADANFTYTSAGDFIVGSYQIDDTGTGTEDKRMFFDVATGAFRAGEEVGGDWDQINLGDQSFAVGSYTRATGNNSAAIGQGVEANANWSYAIGRDAFANANYSFAIGLGTTGTEPQVSGTNSMAIFMSGQDSVNLSSSNTFGLFGGSMVIDPNNPATNLSADTALEIEGSLKIAYGGEACDAAREGAIRFVSATNSFAFCADTGNDWETVALGAGVTEIDDLSDAATNYTSGSMYIGQGAPYTATGIDNTTLGLDAGTGLTSGASNTLIGAYAGEALTTQISNTAVGTYALNANTGNYNTSVGNFSLVQSLGASNTALGSSAATNLINGNDNVFIGELAGRGDNTGFTWDGAENVIIGQNAAVDLDGTNNQNTIIGSDTAATLTGGGSGNILLGYGVDVPSATTSNYINIGNVIYGSADTGYSRVAGTFQISSSGEACDAAREGAMQYGSGGSNIFEVCADSATGWEQLALGGTVSGALNDLSDVNTAGFADGDLLLYSAGASAWVPGDAPLVGAFTDLTDTPANYTGQGGRFAVVNAGETALEFSDTIIETVTGEPLPDTINLNDLGDASVSGATDGQYLTYDSASGNWVAGTISSSSVSAAGADTQIQFNSGGEFAASADLVFTSTGRLGLGTSSPGQNLHISDAGTPGLLFTDTSSSTQAGFALSGNNFTIFQTSFGSEQLLNIDLVTNNVGINNSSPLAALDIGGDIKFASSSLACDSVTHEGAMQFGSGGSNIFEVCANSATGWEQLALGGTVSGALDDLSDVDVTGVTDGQFLAYNAGATDWVAVDNPGLWTDSGAGYIEYSSTLGGVKVASVTGAAAPSGATKSVILSAGDISAAGADSQIQFNSGGDFAANANFVFTSAGRLGLGTSAPVSVFDVAGDIRFASSSLACNSATHEGAMQFGSGGSNIFEVCANSATGWEQLALGGTVAGALNDLSDVNTTGFADGNVLLYSAGASAWVPGDAPLVGAFTDLTDTPANYTGQGGRFAVVNSGETAIEFTDQVIESVSGEPAPNTIDLTDLGDVSAAGALDGQYLTYDSATGNWVAGTIASTDVSAAGIDRQIQFNSGGSFAADTSFVYTSAGYLGLGTATPSTVLYASGSTVNGDYVATIRNSNADGEFLSLENSIGTPVVRFTQSATSQPRLLMNDADFEKFINLEMQTQDVVLTIENSRTTAGDNDAILELDATSIGESKIAFMFDGIETWQIEAGDSSNQEFFISNPSLSAILNLENDGDFGVGTVDPRTRLDVMGTLKIDHGGEACDAAREGAIHFDSAADRFYVCQNAAEGWVNIATNNAEPAAPNRAIQFNSASSFAADSTFIYTSAGNLGVGTATPAVKLDVVGDIRTSNSLILQPVSGLAAPTYISAGSVASTLGELTDVDVTGVADGQVLLYSAGASAWVVGYSSGSGGGGSIDGLSDAATDYTTDFNFFMGSGAGASIASGGQYNLAIGQGAMSSVTTGDANLAIGRNTITALTNSSGTVAIGNNAGRLYTMVEFALPSVFIGNNAGEQTGYWGNASIVAIGSNALAFSGGFDPVGGSTVIGTAAMENAGQNGPAEDNTVIGNGAGIYQREGSDNVYIGAGAASGGNTYNHTGDNNVFIGKDSANSLDGANNNNIFLGQGTGLTLNAGDDNLLIGTGIDVPSATASNYMSIADVIYASGIYNATTHIGISNATPDVELDVTGDIEYTGTLTDVSDMRLKTDITPLNTDEIMAKLAQVNTYSFRMKDDPKGALEFGVMAQELEKQFPELVKTAKDEMGTKSVNYVGLIAPLIEASKELKSENDTLRAELAEMKTAQAKFEADIMQQVNGLKAHTGYGISKAQMGLWMLVIMFGSLSLWFVIGGMVRNRQNKQL